MDEQEVVDLCNLFKKENIEVWIDGGWGIDALLEEHTRQHKDLDIALKDEDVLKLRQLLVKRGYKQKQVPLKEWNFVLVDKFGHEIDVHTFKFDQQGNNIYGILYPRESLTGKGKIGNKVVNCIAPEWVVKFHSSYEPDRKDLEDIKALCQKFDLKYPENYLKYL